LARLSGVPKRTIVNWLDGTVKHPRHWQSVVRVAAALRQPRMQTDELLAAAALPDLQSLMRQSNDADDCLLLENWQLGQASILGHAPCLFHYLEALSAELARLPAYFPRQTLFTFSTIYQDLRLRKLENTPPADAPQLTQSVDFFSSKHARKKEENEGELWSLVRQKSERAVILGQPGMGKTWLLKAEAMRLADEALQGYGHGEPEILPLLIRMPDLAPLLGGQSGMQEIRRAIAKLAARQAPKLPEADRKSVV